VTVTVGVVGVVLLLLPTALVAGPLAAVVGAGTDAACVDGLAGSDCAPGTDEAVGTDEAAGVDGAPAADEAPGVEPVTTAVL
jgi:hypothetical protein